MRKVEIISHAAKKFKNGYPLIDKEDLQTTRDFKEGEWVALTLHNQFVAYGYFAEQNRGDGWIFSRNEEARIDEDFFSKLFNNARMNRKSLFTNKDTNAFRFFNGEGEGIGGLTIDYYDDYYIFTWYNLGLYQHKDMIYNAFSDAVTSYKGIYANLRYDTKGEPSTFKVRGKDAPTPLIVKENGLQFAAYLNEATTGLFLEQREMRKAIMNKYAEGKLVFNGFSNTGATSVAASVGGALKTTSVDVMNKNIDRMKEQFALNNIDPEKQEIRGMDVFGYLDYAKKHHIIYDLVVLDPPSFVRSKKRTFSVQKDYAKLAEDAIDITQKDGIIMFSTNAAGLTLKKLKEQITEAFANKNRSFTLLETFRLSSDFVTNKEYRQGNYLKTLVIKVD